MRRVCSEAGGDFLERMMKSDEQKKKRRISDTQPPYSKMQKAEE